MQVLYKQNALERIELELTFTGGFRQAVVSAYRGRIQLIRAAPQEQALLQLRCLRMERGNGTSYSMRVTDDWDLIVAFEDGEDDRVAVVEAMIERTTTKTEQPS